MPYKNKEQQKAYLQQHYTNNKESYQARKRKQREERYIWYNEIMSTKSCIKCSESAIECLDWHHTNPSTKRQEVPRLLHDFRSLNEVLEEMNKCVILCANCHRKLHAGTISLN